MKALQRNEHSTTTGDGEARHPEVAKYSATTGDDEARPPEAAKYGLERVRKSAKEKAARTVWRRGG